MLNLSRDNPARAASFVEELAGLCREAARAPESFPARPELAAGLRMAVHGRYLVFFRDLPDAAEVRIERVLHSARNLRPLL